MLLLACLFIGIGLAQAQVSSVTGTVTSADDGLPITGASVLIKGTTIGTITDIDGNFTIQNIPSSAKTLVVSFVGMESKEVAIKEHVDVVLSSDSELLDEVVVTGYGVTRKRAFTGAATTVGTEQIETRNDANAIKALEGSVAGLQLNMSTGQPGAQANIFIRGRNSLNSGTQPLYVIDGVPMVSDEMGMSRGSGVGTSPLASINSSDIETITVLKDATATSIYGARAANGVIVITTKKGAAGKPRVNLNVKLGFEQMPSYTDRYKVVNSDQYWELATQALVNDYTDNGDNSYLGAYGYDGTLAGAEEMISDFYGISRSAGINTDWLKEATRNGFFQEYGVDVSGGGSTENAPKYFASLNYLDQDGFMLGKDLSRYSFRFNLDHSPNKTFTYGFTSNVSYTKTNAGNGGGYFSDPLTQVYMLNPNYPVKDEYGEWYLDTNTGYNPVALRSKYGDKNIAKNFNIITSAYLQINFWDKVTWLTRAGVDAVLLDEFGYMSFLNEEGVDYNGYGDNGNTTRTLANITNTLNYIDTFGDKHHLNILLGQESQKTHMKEAYMVATNYPVRDLMELTLASSPSAASTEQYDLVLNSWFANAQYDYDNKYYLSASYRYDGSSRFGSNNRWAPFWSVGAKYRISSEPFMEPTKNWLTNLTVRASYGTTGNQEVGQNSYSDGEGASFASWYSARNLYGFGHNYNGAPGSYHMQTGNPDLKWETTEKFNVGIDFSLWNRINVELDYYSHKTRDMVFAVPISMTTGLSESYQNLGELTNKGFEASIDATIIKSNKFQWDMRLNASYNKNKMTKMSSGGSIEGTYNIVEVGYPIYEFYMREWAGVDPETGEGLWYKGATGHETTTDYNEAAKRHLGSANPKWQGSIGTSFSYAGFDLSAQFNYSLGGKIYGNSLRYDEQVGASFGDTFTEYVYKNHWVSPSQPGNGEVPKLTAESNSWNKHSSRFLMDGDYLKLRSVTLGYTFPKSVTNKLQYVNSLRLYAQGENLFTITASNYRGLDPSSAGASGIQWWNYPLARSLTFGLSVGF